jgi:hypothetical protein
MADLTYKFTGVNTAQLANEVRLLRQNSSTFRDLEATAAAAGYKTIEIQMGAGLLPKDIADSTRTNSSTRTIRINSDATGSWGVGGRQATVGEVIAHELAHAVIPQVFKEPGVYNFRESGTEGMWVRRQTGQVALDLGLPGPNNADYLITRIPINETQGCTVQKPEGDGAQDGVLFLDGSRGYNGIGSTIPPASGSRDSINSRRLAADEIGQDMPPADSNPDRPASPPEGGGSPAIIGSKPVRYLGRRIVGKSPASVVDTSEPLSSTRRIRRSLDNRRRMTSCAASTATIRRGSCRFGARHTSASAAG